ncbi:MAG: ATP/GTP-binding protein [Pseudomonadota bacterium]
MKRILSVATVLASLATTGSADPFDWTAGPFDMPESAIYDAPHDRIVLSVIGGHPGMADGNGLLALVSPEGAILDPDWVTGLDAPKGMAILGDTLLVTDLTRLHEIDLSTGQIQRSLEVEDTMFLNDITADGQQAFVSDLMANRIWRYAAGALTLWLEDETLAHPNGLLLDGDRLIVGSWGPGIREDFTTQEPGALLSVDLATKAVETLVHRLGNLDGVARIGDVLLVNDWITGQLFEIAADGTATVVAQYPAGLADISTHGDRVFLPSMLEGTLSARSYP